jgi:hypothetical protein
MEREDYAIATKLNEYNSSQSTLPYSGYLTTSSGRTSSSIDRILMPPPPNVKVAVKEFQQVREPAIVDDDGDSDKFDPNLPPSSAYTQYENSTGQSLNSLGWPI